MERYRKTEKKESSLGNYYHFYNHYDILITLNIISLL